MNQIISNVEYTVRQDLCQHCGQCKAICNIPSENSYPNFNGELCCHCFHCYAVCPHQAIELNFQLQDADKEISPLLSHTTELSDGSLSITHPHLDRRSYREFTSEPIPEDLLNRIIKATKNTPSGGNVHGHEFTVLLNQKTRADMLSELKKIYHRLLKITHSPLLLKIGALFLDRKKKAFLTDKLYQKTFQLLVSDFLAGQDPMFYNAPAVIIVHSKRLIPTPQEDSIIAGYQFQLEALKYGLGSCFVSLAQNAFDLSPKLKKIIDLTPKDQVHAVIAIGYPKTQFYRPTPRPDPQIHWIRV